MGELLLASTTGPGGFEKHVAIKRLHPEMASNPAVVKMFLDEARICAGLRHPNIVEIFDLGEGPEGAYILMEYLDGHDLRGLLKRVTANHGRIPVEIAVHIVQAVCRGLHHAHERTDATGAPLHIVHRDVSPQNVFATFEGHVKVIDFGIAKANGRLGHTRTGTIKGKFGYMSPEQARGRDVDRRSDIFCAGVLLFELSTTRKLFRGDDEYELLEAVVKGRYPRPSALVDGYPHALERIVMRALAVDPADRYTTAMELHDELEALNSREGWRVNSVDLSRYLAGVFAAGELTPNVIPPSPLPPDEPSRATITMPEVRGPVAPARRHRGVWRAVGLGVAASAVVAVAWTASHRGGSTAPEEGASSPVMVPAVTVEPIAPAGADVADPAPAPAADTKPVADTRPVADKKPAADMKPAADKKPAADIKPAATPARKTTRRKTGAKRRVESPSKPPSKPVSEPATTSTESPPCTNKWEPC